MTETSTHTAQEMADRITELEADNERQRERRDVAIDSIRKLESENWDLRWQAMGLRNALQGIDSIAGAETGELAGQVGLIAEQALADAPKPDTITRLEVIDANGRSYQNHGVTDCRLSYQDEGRTLKVFVGGRGITTGTSAIARHKADEIGEQIGVLVRRPDGSVAMVENLGRVTWAQPDTIPVERDQLNRLADGLENLKGNARDNYDRDYIGAMLKEVDDLLASQEPKP